MVTLFITLGSGQPNAPGYIEVKGKSHESCREAVYRLTAGRFCTHYHKLEDLHYLDRIKVCEIEAVSAGEECKSIIPYLISVEDGKDMTAFEGYDCLVEAGR